MREKLDHVDTAEIATFAALGEQFRGAGAKRPE